MRIHPRWKVALLVPFALPLIAGCAREKAPQAEVNPAFERNPPIAREVRIKQLKGGTAGRVQVVADFGRGALASPFHAVALSSGKVVLRDDGKGGDQAAGDGLFTTTVQDNLDSLSQSFQTAERRMSVTAFHPPPVFRGRQLFPPDTLKAALFDLKTFKAGVFVPIDPSLFCFLLHDVSIPQSLMITSVGVVEDPSRTNQPCSPGSSAAKAWTFGKLMTDMANTPVTGVSAEDFTKRWLDSWLHNQTVNGDLIPARARLFNLVISPWVIRSGSPAGSFTITNWMTRPLDLNIAPFKLTAIVNRLDLRGNAGYGFANPGEGRFIFEVLNPTTCIPLDNPPGAFTVIFEYGLPIHTCSGLKTFAQNWYNLKTLTLGSPGYNAALQALTDVFATVNADPSKPNGSAINQIRTNEIVLSVGTSKVVWELREFNLDATTHHLFTTTVKQEPATKYNAKAVPAGSPYDVTLMADWVNANATDIKADKHTVPLTLSGGQPFLGGKSHTELFGFWDAAPLQIADDDARHHFSLNTCSGCHGGETRTRFLQVGRAPFGTQAPLAGFLTGITVADPAGRPAGSPTLRSFNDLERRQQSLERLLCTQCKFPVFELIDALTFKPITMVH